MDRVTIVESPRDAWQGIGMNIPTVRKVEYLANLVSLGFSHIDAVSFVSPKHVPQMADSDSVIQQLEAAKLPNGNSPDIIGIVFNSRGLDRALAAQGVSTVGVPYSISKTFARANANTSLLEARTLVKGLQRRTAEANRKLVMYISMAFGNPYDEPWHAEIVEDAVVWLQSIGVRLISLADTVGVTSPEGIFTLYRTLLNRTLDIEIGVHLHTRAEAAGEKILAAHEAGCRRFDGALTGLGGCPFAGDDLVGNIPTETIVSSLSIKGVDVGLDENTIPAAHVMTTHLIEQYA